MTGNDILKLSLQILEDAKCEPVFAQEDVVNWINRLLQETIVFANQYITKHKTRELFSVAPRIKTLDEEIPYEDTLLTNAFPLEIARLIGVTSEIYGEVSALLRQKFILELYIFLGEAQDAVVDELKMYAEDVTGSIADFVSRLEKTKELDTPQ